MSKPQILKGRKQFELLPNAVQCNFASGKPKYGLVLERYDGSVSDLDAEHVLEVVRAALAIDAGVEVDANKLRTDSLYEAYRRALQKSTPSMQPEIQWLTTDAMYYVSGSREPYKCSCGCNVFRASTCKTKAKCNSCDATFSIA